MLRQIFAKISHGLQIIKYIKNWPVYFLDYFSLLRDKIVIIKLRNGVKYKIRAGTNDRGIINEIWLDKNYLLDREDIKDGSIIIDLGAQIGAFSVFAATRGRNVKVYAYEPLPDNFKLLTENIKLNNLSDNILPFNKAVLDSGKDATLYVDKKDMGGHSVFFKHGCSITVKAISLEEVFKDNELIKCDLLKIDIEGSEYPVLFNASKETLKKIEKIYLECHKIPDNKFYTPLALRKKLQKNDFEIVQKKQYLYAIRLNKRR